MEVSRGDEMANGLRFEVDTNFKVECLAPEGTGLGVGSISLKKRLDNGEITQADLGRVSEILNDPTYYPPVEFGDDGCSDGRGTVSIYQLTHSKEIDPEQPDGPLVSKAYYNRSGHRSKIFGGGLNIGWVMRRVIAGVPQIGETLNGDRLQIARELPQRGLEFGGHIGSHAQGKDIGCKALDDTVPIIGVTVENANEIYALTKKVKGDRFDDSAFNRTMEVFEAITKSHNYIEGATGRAAKDILDHYGAVIKELDGPHLEVAYMRQHKPGVTLWQARVNAETDGKLQIFNDDVWRRDEYADKLGAGKDELIKLADMAGEVITLGTTVALTDGTLQVYQRTAA